MRDDSRPSSRRAFLSGRSALGAARAVGDRALEDLGDETATIPVGRDTVRLATRAMATDFAVVLNPGPARQLILGGDALALLEPLEQKMTVYRPDADLVRVNATAADEAVEVDPELFAVLIEAARLARLTGRTFDPTSGPLIALWRRCRAEQRIPTEEEIAATLEIVGIEHVTLDADTSRVRFDRAGVELNLGGIGKGFALDRCAAFLDGEELGDFLLHGGKSSILARGDHAGQGGWPVGIVDPLTRNKRLATLLLRDQAMSTSGSSIQYFRHEGRRYGHILDPRTGWPAEGTLSVTTVAPTAAEADALSTAIFAGGVEIARAVRDNSEKVGAVLVPEPQSGRTLRPLVLGLAADQLFFHDESVEPRWIESTGER